MTIILKSLNKKKDFASLKEALNYCEEATCFLYSISVENNEIVARGNGVEFLVATLLD